MGIILGIASFYLVTALVIWWRDRLKSSLKHHILAERARAKKDASLRDKLSPWLLMEPRWSVDVAVWTISLVILVIEFLFLWFGDVFSFSPFIFQEPGEFVATLWQVQASILGVIFVVAVFLFQALVSQERVEGESLLWQYVRESRILPIAAFGLSSIASAGITDAANSFSWFETSGISFALLWNIVLFAGNLGLTLYLYRHTFRLLAPSYLDRALSKVVKRAAEQSVKEVLDVSMGRVILQDKLNEWEGLGPNFSFARDRRDYAPIRYDSKERLEVSDIDLDELEYLDLQLRIRQSKESRKRGFVAAYYGKSISSLNNTIGHVLESVRDEEIEYLFRTCIRARPEGDDLVQTSLEDLKARTMSAIRQKRAGRLEKLLDAYLAAIRSFHDVVTRYDESYVERAGSGSLFFDWPILRTIDFDLYDIVRAAVETSEKQVAEEAIRLSRKTFTEALELGEPEIAARFSSLIPFSYQQALKLPDNSSTRAYLIKQTWRNLKNIADYRLSRRITELHTTEEDFEAAQAIADVVLKTFNRLLKAALDAHNHAHFQDFSSVLENTFDWEIRRGELNRIRDDTEIRIEFSDDEAEIQKLEEKIQRVEQAEDALERIDQIKSLIRFGMGAWNLALLRRGKLETEEFQQYYQTAKTHFRHFRELESVYGFAEQEIWQRNLGWSQWDDELHERKAGEVKMRAVTRGHWLAWFYIMRGLELVSPDSNYTIEPHADAGKRNRQIVSKLNRLKENEPEWLGAFNIENLEARVDNFLEMHQRAADEWEEIERQQLREKDIDPERIEEFKRHFHERWLESPTREVLDTFSTVKERLNDVRPEDAYCVGRYTPWYPKGVFVEGSGFSLEHEASALGQSLVREEAKRLSARLGASLPTWCTEEKDQLPISINEAAAILESRGYEVNVIITNDPQARFHLWSAEAFVPKSRARESEWDINAYVGKLSDTPIFAFPNGEDPFYLIADLEAMGRWEQYGVAKDTLGQPLLFKVEHTDKDKAEELYNNHEGLRQDDSGNERPKDTVIEELQEHVVMDVAECFDFVIDDQDAGVRIDLEQSDLTR